jgi:opacity protein-like surface antigen
MAKFYVSKGLSLEAGPQIGFLLKSEVDIEVNNALFASSTTEDVKDFTKSTDFAFNIGAGYQLNSGLNFNLRYNIGLTDAYEDIDAKNSVFQVGVGYTF